jgi:hydrogenase nickel incorporation protein HypA/HybF
MHEFGIANSIIDAVRAESKLRSGVAVRTVGLRVGRASGVDPDSLSFCFDALVQGSDLDPLKLEIEMTPILQECPRCEREFEVTDFDFSCPTCGEPRTARKGGFELDLAYMEVEEP